MSVNLENTSFLVIIQSRTISRWIVNTRNLNFVTVQIILEIVFFSIFMCDFLILTSLPPQLEKNRNLSWENNHFVVFSKPKVTSCLLHVSILLNIIVVAGWISTFFFVIMSVVLCAWELLWLLNADESKICSSEPYNRWTWRGWFKDILVSTKMCNQFS